MTKLSLSQIEDSYRADVNVGDFHPDFMEEDSDFPIRVEYEEIDETSFRNTFQRKEIRTNRKREDGELVGKGNINKHRKY